MVDEQAAGMVSEDFVVSPPVLTLWTGEILENPARGYSS
jgi:hypothetical protein